MAALKFTLITILVLFSLATYCDGRFGVLTAAAGGKNGSVGKYLYLLDRIWNAFENIKSIWDSFDGKPNYAAPDTSASAMLYYSLTDVMETWDAAFEDLRQTIKERSDYMENLVVELESESRVKMEMDEFHNNLLAIRDKYRQFQSLVKGHRDGTEVEGMGDFIFNYLSSGEVETLILRVYDFVTPTLNTQDDFLLTLFTHHKTLEVTNHLCKLRHSPVDFFQALLSGLLSTEMHGYMLLVAGTTFLYTHQNDEKDQVKYPYSLPPSEKVKIWNIRAQRRLQSYLSAFINIMENSATNIVQCPPQSMEQDVTYLELAGFIQYVVQPHRNLVEWSGDYQHVLHYNYMRECHGVFDFEKKVQGASVCPKQYSHRRYEFIHLPGDDHHPERCFREELPLSEGVLGKCFDNAVNSKSTHTVNLLPVEADPYNNMVVTGMKFVIVHGILHIQIAQGQLGPNFEVLGSSWKPVDDISDRVRASRIQVDYEGGPSGLEINRHYAVLDKTNKYFEFGAAVAEHGYVVTGLKFQLSQKNRLHVAIIARKFNPESGKLNFNSPSVTLSPTEVNYNLPVYKDRPFDLTQTDKLETTNQGYVEFDSTKWETDRGQTTVPYFDARPFDTNPPAPLLGVNTYYQYNDHFPGLISFEYRGLNYTRYNIKNLDTINDFIEAEDGSLLF